MIPHATERIGDWREARRRAGRLLVALDFDGTLAPIVERPEAAALLPAARAALERLATRSDTDLAVVSGRALRDLQERVPLTDVYYAGNHGMEIEGPGLRRVHREAAAARPALLACLEALDARLRRLAGVQLEDKELTFSVHFRQVHDPAVEAEIRAEVERVCGGRPEVRTTSGKKVVEVRPAVDWDKGRATRFILSALEAGGASLVPALFVGDDRTDEDAFRALDGRGDGVVVAEAPPSDTAATAFVRSPEEVAALLAALADDAP